MRISSLIISVSPEMVLLDGAKSKYPLVPTLVLLYGAWVEVSDIGRKAGVDRCAVTGLECVYGSVPWDIIGEKVSVTAGTRSAAESLRGLGRNAGSVGDSGCVSCKTLTSES